MRIGVDARPLASRPAGIGHYLQEMLSAMAVVSGHEFILYAHRPIVFSPSNPNWRTRVHRSPKGTGPIWFQLYASRVAARDDVDLFWGAHFLLPPGLPKRIRSVITVYDLVPFLYPQTMRFTASLVYRRLLPPSLARADHVTVISHAVAADLQRTFHLAPDMISVIPPGVAPHFRPIERDTAVAHVARAFGVDRPYLLAVGTVEPRKNLLTLVRAIADLPLSLRQGIAVVIAGARGWKNSSLVAAATPLLREGTLRFLGYVPDADLAWLYSGAIALAYPSLYEGFGIPVIEAMACGTPVIASDIPVLREVAGEAAVFVPPLDTSRWSSAIADILEGASSRVALSTLGIARAAQFSYQASAQRMLDVFERLVRVDRADDFAPA